MPMEQRVARWIAGASDLLLICHLSPDGDALGSLLGLGLALERLPPAHLPAGRRAVYLICADPVPQDARHLPAWERVITPHSEAWAARESWVAPDAAHAAVISLDCSSPDRLGQGFDAALWSDLPLLNIDHHPTNSCFGELNWVEPKAAATAQMLVPLIRALNAPLDVEIATCLLHGILTDTRGFRTSNTSPAVLRTAADLMDCGAPLATLNDLIFNRRPLAEIQLWAQALQRLELHGRILCSEITQQMRQRVGYHIEGSAGLVSYLNTANQADIAVVFDERPDGEIGVSMRSVQGVDVSQVAVALGGGGHAQAAGCEQPGPLDRVKGRVLPLLHEALKSQTSAP